MWPRLQGECRSGCKLASFLAKLILRPWQSGAPIWHGWKILDWLSAIRRRARTRRERDPAQSRDLKKGKRRLAGAGHVRNTRSLERFRLYGPYYTPPTLIAITVRRCISAIIAFASNVEGLHTHTQSFVVRPWGLRTSTRDSRQPVILTAAVKLLIAAGTCHSKRSTHIFSHKLYIKLRTLNHITIRIRRDTVIYCNVGKREFNGYFLAITFLTTAFNLSVLSSTSVSRLQL